MAGTRDAVALLPAEPRELAEEASEMFPHGALSWNGPEPSGEVRREYLKLLAAWRLAGKHGLRREVSAGGSVLTAPRKEGCQR